VAPRPIAPSSPEGEDAAQVKDLVISAGVGIVGSIIASGHPEYVNDVDHDVRAVQIAGPPKGATSV
jgi:hypothetical protein